MPEIQVGKAHIYGLANSAGVVMTLAYTGSPYAGTIIPIFKSLRLAHSIEVKQTKNTFGITTGLITDDEIIECTFEFIPEGATRAEAATSAKFPGVAICTLANLPVMTIGSFANVLNSDAWIYLGGGSINGESEKEWSATLPLKRFVGIPAPGIVVG